MAVSKIIAPRVSKYLSTKICRGNLRLPLCFFYEKKGELFVILAIIGQIDLTLCKFYFYNFNLQRAHDKVPGEVLTGNLSIPNAIPLLLGH